MNPLVDEKAPYVLVLLVSLLGWFLTSAVNEAGKTTLLSYDLYPYIADGSPYLEVVVRNQSLGRMLRDAPIVLTCPRAECLTQANPKTGGSFGTAIGSGSWTVALNPAPEPDTPTAASFTFTPEIPAGGELRAVVGLVDIAVVPTISFGMPARTNITPQLERGFSIRGWIFSNYFWIMVVGAVLSFGIFLWWVAALQNKKAEVVKNELV
jgi:hypothetical protein